MLINFVYLQQWKPKHYVYSVLFKCMDVIDFEGTLLKVEYTRARTQKNPILKALISIFIKLNNLGIFISKKHETVLNNVIFEERKMKHWYATMSNSPNTYILVLMRQMTKVVTLFTKLCDSLSV